MAIPSRLPHQKVPGIPFHEYFFKTTKPYSDNVAMINHRTKETHTFSDLHKQARKIGTALVNLGVEKGEVVVLCMDNSPEAVYILLGISFAGAAASTLSPRLHAEEMRDQILESETRFLFVDPLGLEAVDRVFQENIREHRIICTGSREASNGYPILVDLNYAGSQRVKFPIIFPQEDMVYLPFSSGIHGSRKGIVTTHYVMNAKTAAAYNPEFYVHPEPGEHTVAILPFNKQMGLETLLISLMNGATVVTAGVQCVHTFLKCIEQYEVKTVNMGPLVMSLMIRETENHDYNIRSLVTVITGTAPVTKGLHQHFMETFPSVKYIVPTYGMTEVGVITRGQPSSKFTTTCGALVSGMELKVSDLISGLELGPNEKGHIFVRGPSAMSPYLNNIEATEEVLQKGWRKTGDIGYYDEQENVYIVDKTKEMIKVHGFQVIPTELESVLLEHPAVEEAVVVPIDDEDTGERPVAFIVVKPGHLVTPVQVQEYVNERVVRFKRLVGVNIAQTLPRSPCGNPLRRLLSEAAVLNAHNIP